MKEFLNKYVYIIIDKVDIKMRHVCAKVTGITPTHISLFDTFDNKPYMHRIADIITIELSKKNPGENGY